MKRNAGARDAGAKIESRFAALTGGLLARKGQAAPSNSPIADASEETEAYTLDNSLIPRKLAPRPKAEQESVGKAPPAAKPESSPTRRPPASPFAPIAASKPELKEPAPQAAAKESAPAAQPARPSQPAAMTVINERSVEAGYPDNPSPEEIAALEAEADEVVSYFENFGSTDAAAVEKNSFFDGAIQEPETDAEEDADDFDDGLDDEIRNELANGPWAGASVPPVAAAAEPVRAGVTVQLTAREFMRLSLGAAELGLSAQEIMADAIEEYLDTRGVESLGGCACLMKVQGGKSGARRPADSDSGADE